MSSALQRDTEDDRYSVVQFFVDGLWERVLERVPGMEAMSKARWCSTSVGAQVGTTTRVIVVDGGDSIVFEWKGGQGITYPPELVGCEWVPE